MNWTHKKWTSEGERVREKKCRQCDTTNGHKRNHNFCFFPWFYLTLWICVSNTYRKKRCVLTLDMSGHALSALASSIYVFMLCWLPFGACVYIFRVWAYFFLDQSIATLKMVWNRKWQSDNIKTKHIKRRMRARKKQHLLLCFDLGVHGKICCVGCLAKRWKWQQTHKLKQQLSKKAGSYCLVYDHEEDYI